MTSSRASASQRLWASTATYFWPGAGALLEPPELPELRMALKKSPTWAFGGPFASVTILNPAGVCIQELAARMKKAERVGQKKTRKPAIQGRGELARARPKGRAGGGGDRAGSGGLGRG